MEFINQWLAEMGIAPIVGAVVIAVATIIAAKIVQLLGRRAEAQSIPMVEVGNKAPALADRA